MSAIVTQTQAYDLYRKYAERTARYTHNHITGKIESNLLPPVEDGLTEYHFCGSGSLADFLSFVVFETAVKRVG
jgi:hypothetical protein